MKMPVAPLATVPLMFLLAISIFLRGERSHKFSGRSPVAETVRTPKYILVSFEYAKAVLTPTRFSTKILAGVRVTVTPRPFIPFKVFAPASSCTSTRRR